MSERERVVAGLRQAIADLDEMEATICKLEDRVWQPHWSRNDPLHDRLLRTGVSRAAADKIQMWIDCMDKIKRGSPLPEEANRALADTDAAEASAKQQLAALLARR